MQKSLKTYRQFRSLSALILGLLASACVSSPLSLAKGRDAKPQVPHFAYDAKTGACRDGESGTEGFNHPLPDQLFAATSTNDAGAKVYGPGSGECVDFNGFDFSQYVGIINAELRGFNFQGAKFDGAKMHFAHMTQALLQGANLTNFHIGYVTIEGQGDRYTQPGVCSLAADFSLQCRH